MYVCTPLLDALEGLFNFVTEKFHSVFFLRLLSLIQGIAEYF